MSGSASETFELYRCKKCGKVSVSIGWLHAHIEKHLGFFGFRLPWNVGNTDDLMELTEIVKVVDVDRLIVGPSRDSKDNDQCRYNGCDWPVEWEGGTQCIRHSMDWWTYWRPLANFGPINQRWAK